MQHASFWIGGLALGGVALAYVASVGRALGVSGAVGGVVDADDDDGVVGCDAAGPDDGAPPLRFAEQVVFLMAIAAGAGLSALLAGTWGRGVSDVVGADFVARFGDGNAAWAALLGGGVLVGFGTQLAKGCTSGHGLMGVARLEKASLVATAVFFGTAIAVSVVVDTLLGVRS